jgi:hypothetical protein
MLLEVTQKIRLGGSCERGNESTILSQEAHLNEMAPPDNQTEATEPMEEAKIRRISWKVSCRPFSDRPF